jgi:hypothetical protein
VVLWWRKICCFVAWLWVFDWERVHVVKLDFCFLCNYQDTALDLVSTRSMISRTQSSTSVQSLSLTSSIAFWGLGCLLVQGWGLACEACWEVFCKSELQQSSSTPTVTLGHAHADSRHSCETTRTTIKPNNPK